MTGHCLLLPLEETNKDFGQEFASIYDNWEVGDDKGQMTESMLVEVLFGEDVLAD